MEVQVLSSAPATLPRRHRLPQLGGIPWPTDFPYSKDEERIAPAPGIPGSPVTTIGGKVREEESSSRRCDCCFCPAVDGSEYEADPADVRAWHHEMSAAKGGKKVVQCYRVRQVCHGESQRHAPPVAPKKIVGSRAKVQNMAGSNSGRVMIGIRGSGRGDAQPGGAAARRWARGRQRCVGSGGRSWRPPAVTGAPGRGRSGGWGGS